MFLQIFIIIYSIPEPWFYLFFSKGLKYVFTFRFIPLFYGLYKMSVSDENKKQQIPLVIFSF